MKHTFLILSCIFILFVADAVCGVDWPCYNADPQRSGITAEKLNFPLAPAWTYHPAQAPQPAWPEPGRVLNLLDFDYAFQPVVAGGLVFLVVFIRIMYLPASILLGIWFAMQIFSAFAGGGAGVAWYAHIGGFLVGVLLVSVFTGGAGRGGGKRKRTVHPNHNLHVVH